MTAPLNLRRWPPAGSSPDLVLLHGFTQNVDCWGPFADELATRHQVLAIDAPGHGRSGHDHADLWTTADLVAATIGRARATDAATAAPPVIVGYSMGGRTALHVALAHPSSVAGLVLIGATAGIDGEPERAARRSADERLANRIEDGPLADFIDGWLAGPLFAGLSAEAACRDARLTNRPDGLAASLRSCGTGTQDDLWERLAGLMMPVLLITGSRDTKFGALAERMAEAMTGIVVDRVGIDGTHAVHLEQPPATATAVTSWLKHRFGPG